MKKKIEEIEIIKERKKPIILQVMLQGKNHSVVLEKNELLNCLTQISEDINNFCIIKDDSTIIYSGCLTKENNIFFLRYPPNVTNISAIQDFIIEIKYYTLSYSFTIE